VFHLPGPAVCFRFRLRFWLLIWQRQELVEPAVEGEQIEATKLVPGFIELGGGQAEYLTQADLAVVADATSVSHQTEKEVEELGVTPEAL
jgi:hypothetical protein